MAEPPHSIALRHRLGSLLLDVEFTLRAPWTVLFAPSGGGKTTVLRLIAGLERPLAGRVELNGRVLLDTAAGVFVPPHRRGVGLVAQRPALFPHRDVLGNVRYGAGSRPVDEIAELCRIGHLRGAAVAALSGGERQRVALARTLAAGLGGGLLLLDEPFTGMDDELRYGLLRDLRAWVAARGVAVLMVTHEVGEVFAADAAVLRMESGRVVAEGTAAEVLSAERGRLRQVLR